MSAYVVEALGGALLSLMREKKFEKISVDELTAKAGLGRVTYFRNFARKEDILTAYIVLCWKAYEKAQNLRKYPMNSLYRVRSYFSFCYSMRDINDTIFAAGQESAILRAYEEIIVKKEDNSTYDRSFLSYGLYGVFLHWARAGYQESPEEMASIAVTRLLSSRVTELD